RFLVVCGLSETIASFVPTSLLRSVDFPAFGRPISDTKPDFIGRTGGTGRTGRMEKSYLVRLRFRVLRVFCSGDVLVDPHLADAAPLGVDDLDDEAVDIEALADARHASNLRHQEAANGLESFPLDFHIQQLRHFVDVDLAREQEAAVSLVDDRLGLDVILVANLADDFFEEILDRHEPGRAAVFVDDDGALRLLTLELFQQLGNTLRFGDDGSGTDERPNRRRI